MQCKRVFKTKTFDRWARKLIPDAVLCKAASEIAQGLYEADLGQGVCEKSDPGVDFSAREEEAAKLYAAMLQKVGEGLLARMVTDGALKEICNDTEDDEG